jgi:hypothetical protein
LSAAETGHLQGVQAAREELRAAMRELFDATTAVNRFGTNLNQAVAALHVTGQPPAWMTDAVALCCRAIEKLDEVAAKISHCLPTRRHR